MIRVSFLVHIAKISKELKIGLEKFSLMLTERILSIKYPIDKDSFGIILHHHSGEAYLICALLKEFKKIHNIEKIVLLGTCNYHKDIFELFKSDIDSYVIIEHRFHSLLRDKFIDTHRKIEKGNYYLAADVLAWRMVSDFIKDKNYTFLDENKISHGELIKSCIAMTNLPVKYSMPNISEYASENVRKKFEELNLAKNKTVLISVDYQNPADSFDVGLMKIFWSKIASKLQSKGYSIVVNSANKCDYLQNVSTIFLNYAETIAFLKLCHSTIGIRSGLYDILSSVDTSFHIIYSDEDFLKMFSLDYLIKNNKLDEYIFSENKMNEIIDKITSQY